MKTNEYQQFLLTEVTNCHISFTQIPDYFTFTTQAFINDPRRMACTSLSQKGVVSVYVYNYTPFFVNNGFFKLFALRGFSIFQEKKKKNIWFLVFLLDLLNLILFQYNFKTFFFIPCFIDNLNPDNLDLRRWF